MNTKTIIVLLSLFMLSYRASAEESDASSTTPTATVFLNSENMITAEGVRPRLNALILRPVTEQFGVQCFGLVDAAPKYGQFYCGPMWSPVNTFTVSASVGLETVDQLWRVAASALYMNNGWMALGIVEYGGSGLFYKALLTRSWAGFSAGVLTQRFSGTGVIAAYDLPIQTLTTRGLGTTIWLAPVYDLESGLNSHVFDPANLRLLVALKFRM